MCLLVITLFGTTASKSMFHKIHFALLMTANMFTKMLNLTSLYMAIWPRGKGKSIKKIKNEMLFF